MRVVVTVENRFDITPEGAIWTPMVFPYRFWLGYLDVFDRVRIVSRGRRVAAVPANYMRVDGEGVELYAMPYYHGPAGFARVALAIIKAAQRSFERSDAVIMRVGSVLATCLEPALRQAQHPYGVEVVGDSYEAFARGSIRHPLRPFFQRWLTKAQQRQCANAAGAAYVTQRTLQRRYPCVSYEQGISDVEISETIAEDGASKFSTFYSSVNIENSQIITHNRDNFPAAIPGKLILVGSLEHHHKGADVLIKAVAECLRTRHIDLWLTIVGDGRYRVELEDLARILGISDHVNFLGMLPAGEAIAHQLDLADLFVLPSRTEGLPRAMIEAMARGLPCIGSDVGGIPELLETAELVPSGDVHALATKIYEVLADPARLVTMSIRNLEKSKQYRREVLRERRIQFYQYIQRVTEQWLSAGSVF